MLKEDKNKTETIPARHLNAVYFSFLLKAIFLQNWR